MRGQIRAATPPNAIRSRVSRIILALALVTVQVGASAIRPTQAIPLSPEPGADAKMAQIAQNKGGDPGNPDRIRELAPPKTDGALKSDPGNPDPTKQQAPPPSTTENTQTQSTDKPE
jgi:hypothetical protein